MIMYNRYIRNNLTQSFHVLVELFAGAQLVFFVDESFHGRGWEN